MYVLHGMFVLLKISILHKCLLDTQNTVDVESLILELVKRHLLNIFGNSNENKKMYHGGGTLLWQSDLQPGLQKSGHRAYAHCVQQPVRAHPEAC